jgi:hypothetical protein
MQVIPKTGRAFKLRATNIFVLTLLVVTFGFSCLRQLGDNDLWFQMLAGEYLLQNQRFADSEFFLYPGFERPQFFGGAAFGLILAIAANDFGLSSLSILNSALWSMTLACTLIASAMRAKRIAGTDEDISLIIVAPVVAVLAYAFSLRADIRAETTLYLSWALAAILVEFAIIANHRRLITVGLPLIILTLNFLHTTAFILMFWFLIAWQTAKKSESHEVTNHGREWVLSAVTTLVLCMLHPNGPLQLWVQPIYTITGILRSLSGIPTDNLIVTEYLPIWFSQVSQYQLPWLLLCLLAGAFLWGSRYRSKPFTPTELIMVLGGSAIAALHVRFLGLFTLFLSLPILSMALTYADGRAMKFNSVSKVLIVFGSLVIILVSGLTNRNYGISYASAPLEPLAAIIRSDKSTSIRIATDESGPQLRYLVGPRALVGYGGHFHHPNPDARNHYRNIFFANNWQAELATHDVNYVVLPLGQLFPGRTYILPLPLELILSNEWKLLAIHNNYSLFRRMESEKLSEIETLRQQQRYLIALRANLAFAVADGQHKELENIRSIGNALHEIEAKLGSGSHRRSNTAP